MHIQRNINSFAFVIVLLYVNMNDYHILSKFLNQKSQLILSPILKFLRMDRDMNLFMFVRSIRERNFVLFIRTLESLLPYVFALIHVNCARWLPVFITDMKLLEEKQAIFLEFCRGNFTVSKTGKAFSTIGFDHAHEQNKRTIKGDGGAIGITDNEIALPEWATCGPVISSMLREMDGFEDEDDEDDFFSHHEDTDNFEKSSECPQSERQT